MTGLNNIPNDLATNLNNSCFEKSAPKCANGSIENCCGFDPDPGSGPPDDVPAFSYSGKTLSFALSDFATTNEVY